MASAWGDSWGAAWGAAWGSVAATASATGGGRAPAKRQTVNEALIEEDELILQLFFDCLRDIETRA